MPGVHLATISFGGPEGGYCQIGNEKDTELGVALSLGRVVADREYARMRPVPGFFLNYICGNDDPRVLLPDGSVIKSSSRRDMGWQFCDEVARIFAAENDGIYLQSGFGAENTSMPFQDFLTGLRRCVPNWLRDGTRITDQLWNLHASCAGKRNAKSFATLAKDAKYLKQVRPAFSRDIIGRSISVDGIMGTIGMSDEDRDTYFGPEGVRYTVTLRVNLDSGFGWSHVQVPSRELSVVFDIYDHLLDGSDQDVAIARWVNEQNTEPSNGRRFDIKYSTFDNEGRTTHNGNPIHKMKLSIASPSQYWYPADGSQRRDDGAGKVKQNPPWTTHALLQKLRPVADRVALALKADNEARKAADAAAYEKCARDMGLELE